MPIIGKNLKFIKIMKSIKDHMELFDKTGQIFVTSDPGDPEAAKEKNFNNHMHTIQEPFPISGSEDGAHTHNRTFGKSESNALKALRESVKESDFYGVMVCKPRQVGQSHTLNAMREARNQLLKERQRIYNDEIKKFAEYYYSAPSTVSNGKRPIGIFQEECGDGILAQIEKSKTINYKLGRVTKTIFDNFLDGLKSKPSDVFPMTEHTEDDMYLIF